jgi:hypothetical protein
MQQAGIFVKEQEIYSCFNVIWEEKQPPTNTEFKKKWAVEVHSYFNT